MLLDTSLRSDTLLRLEKIGKADLIVGIPTFNCEDTVANVMRAVAEGLEKHHPGKKAVLFVSDGGSLDDTRENARAQLLPKLETIVAIYRGLPGKGTALRAVFEAGVRLGVKACAVFDADLRSITGEWVRALTAPVLENGYDFVSPYYVRHKYDGTITNHLAYSLTRALYGKRVRQPIGGDFGFSRKMLDQLVEEQVWDTDIAKFGIDIWLTTTALVREMKVCEAQLGAKIHAPKDPGSSLGPMFRQVVGTLFGMMRQHEQVWRAVKGSEPIPLVGTPIDVEPPAIAIDLDRLLSNYRVGLQHFGSLWKEVLHPEQFAYFEKLATAEPKSLHMDPVLWARTVYDIAGTFLRWERNRYKLVEIMTPLYYGRVAAFVQETRDMTTEEAMAKIVETQALQFEKEKPYLLAKLQSWERVASAD